MANKYLKFEYWNTCDLGLIYYQGGQKFTLYLDGDVGEPFHEDVEDGQENGDGDFIPTYRKQMKRYRVRTSLVSDYLVDAVQRMKLHDNIEITFKSGEIERIYNLDVEPEWQFEKYLHQATMVLTFDMDESVTLGACCDNMVIGDLETAWTTLTSGLIIYRKGIRSGFYVIDYSNDGGLTWELDLVMLVPTEYSIVINIDNGVEGYRHQIRGNDYCIDQELTPTGFAGIENTDWENIYIIDK